MKRDGAAEVTSASPPPPRLAAWVLARVAHEAKHDPIIGDLLEEYTRRRTQDPAAARRSYWRQSVGSAGAILLDRINRHSALQTVSTVGLAFLATMIWLTVLNQGPVLAALGLPCPPPRFRSC